MIEGLQPYAKYKESALPWLGRYPSHWVIKRGKSYMTCVDQRSKTGKEELLTVSSARGVVPRSTAKVTMFKAASYAGYKLCWPDDLVINSLWAWGRGLGVTQHHGIISTAYSVYRARPSAQINPRFLHELVRSSAFNWELQVRSKGIWISRLQLTDTAFLDAPIPLPPPDEQAAIVRFLEHANRKIDGFIRAKRKLIALLGEQKQAIIHRAVTGKDEVKMMKDENGNCSFLLQPSSLPKKPSGIPWLGDIPTAWEMIPIKRIASVLNGFAFSSQIYTDSGTPLIRIGDVKSGGSVDIEHAVKLPTDYLISHSFVEIKKGDLLMAMTGATIGKVAIYTHDSPSLLNQRVCAFRCREGRATQEYLFVVLSSRSYLQQVLLACYGGAQPNISDSTLAGFKMPIAPFDLQNEIVASVAKETSPLTAAIARTEREIALMQEYRMRLTADVVTGKLDIRPAAANLPDIIEDSGSEFAGEALEEIEAEEVEA